MLCVLHTHSFKAPSQHTTHRHTHPPLCGLGFQGGGKYHQLPRILPYSFFLSVSIYGFHSNEKWPPSLQRLLSSLLYFVSVKYFAIENVLLLALPYMILSTVLEIGTDAPFCRESGAPWGEGPYPWSHKQRQDQDRGWKIDVLTSSCRLLPCGPLAGADI